MSLRRLQYFLLAVLAVGWDGHAAAADRLVVNLDPDWRFIQADPNGAAARDFDDARWKRVSLPHTFNDVDTFDHWSLPGHKGEQEQWSGRTWYRKQLLVPANWAGKQVFIEFEAVRQVAEVYCNGVLLGISKTGFTPFGFDLTPYLKCGEPNTLAVMADNRFGRDPADVSPADTGVAGGKVKSLQQIIEERDASIPERLEDLQADQVPWNNPHWHPAHGGIYRNVRLYVTDPLHITLPLYSYLQTEGPYVYASQLSPDDAEVQIEIPVANEGRIPEKFSVTADICDAEGRQVATWTQSESVLPAGQHQRFHLQGHIPQPRLWEPGYPHLYSLTLSLSRGRSVADRDVVSFGLRAPRWDAATGFFLNGRHIKLHGWGQKPTDEWPGLGAALPDWLHGYTLQLMQAAGGNFLRWGHAAAGPAQITAADRLGIVTLQPGVDGEAEAMRAAWTLRAQAFRDTLIYFRNHPSILIWEGGNQKLSRSKAAELRGLMDRYDPHGGRAYAHRRPDQVTAEFMDVDIGTEGGREISRLPVVEGEYDREESPRRVWDDFSPPNFGYPEAKGQTYQLTSEQYAVNQVAQYVHKLGAPDHAGGANWIFSDTTSGGRVSVEVARAGGEVDGVRLPKEAYFVCAALFRSEPSVHIIGHWTYPSGTKKTVYVASNAADVELTLNGRSLGHGQVSDRYLFTFPAIAWEPGTLKAIARTGGRTVATQVLRTAGTAVALRITPLTAPGGWRADGSDIALFDVEAIDDQGERCPTFQRRVSFILQGPGIWRGGYNSGKIDSINHLWLDLEAGINRVAVRATREAGTFMLGVTAEGLRPAAIFLRSAPFSAENGLTEIAPAMVSPPVLAAAPPHNRFTLAVAAAPRGRSASKWAGRSVMAFSYSGPSSNLVHVETAARDNCCVYVDSETLFEQLPAPLQGADWVQAANHESQYQAVDLMQLGVAGNSTVWIAHDDRLARPSWLVSQFRAAGMHLLVNGHSLSLFTRPIAAEASLTLGSNTDQAGAGDAQMYVVFVTSARRSGP